MAVFDDVEEAITGVVRAQFSDDQIKTVKIQAGKDSDGDPVLRIFVVFETKNEASIPDGAKMATLARHIMDHFSGNGSVTLEAFPMVSFISSKDWAKLNLEAA